MSQKERDTEQDQFPTSHVSLTPGQLAHGFEALHDKKLSNMEPATPDPDRVTNPDIDMRATTAELEARLSSNAVPDEDRAQVQALIGKLKQTGDQTHLKYKPDDASQGIEGVPEHIEHAAVTKPEPLSEQYALYHSGQQHTIDLKTAAEAAAEYQPVVIARTPVPAAEIMPPSRTSRTSTSVPAAECHPRPRSTRSRTWIIAAAGAICLLSFITLGVLMKSEHTASLPTAIEPSPTQYDQSTSPPRLPPAHVEIAPVKQADMKDQSVTEEPPAQQSTGPAPRVFIYGYKVKKADVRNAENTMLALSTRFGCKPGKLVEYNSSTEAPATLEGTLKSGTTVWIPGDECTYRGAGTRLHDDLILAYTVTPAEAPLSLNDLALRFGCNARSLRRYVRDENPSINTSAIKANTTVFLPKMYCRGIE